MYLGMKNIGEDLGSVRGKIWGRYDHTSLHLCISMNSFKAYKCKFFTLVSVRDTSSIMFN